MIAEDACAHAPTDAEYAKQEAARLLAVRTQRLKDVAILPEDKRRVLHGGLLPTHALHVVRAWHERFKGQRRGEHLPILALLGKTGRGKTVAGAWLLTEEGGLYTTAPELIMRMQAAPRDARDRDWCQAALAARVLIVDDLGTEDLDDAARSALYRVVNQRQSCEQGFCLLTGNLAIPEFRARYGERTARRIDHAGRFVETLGDDLRRKPRER